MTPEQALSELFGRLAAAKGAPVLISEQELVSWPELTVRAMKAAGLLIPASPASGVVCPGCEQECSMPVLNRGDGSETSSFFVVCDKREDISTVAISAVNLRQWGASLAGIAEVIGRLLGVVGAVSVNGPRCEVGIFCGRKHSSHVTLIADGILSLRVGGHVMDLGTVFAIHNGAIQIDRLALERGVDKPVAGGGDVEAADQRRRRLTGEVKAEKTKGTKVFLKVVAAREDISTQRLKQILEAPSEPTRKPR
jgi:hypothetical protein